MTTYSLTKAVAKDAGVDRVVVGGRDITWFRTGGVMGPHMPTQVPSYTLIEPFGYGSSDQLVIPRTNCNFEAYGSGDLAWLKKGATVLYQRVDADGNVIATDYVGFVSSIDTSGREFVAQVGGQLAGRAALMDKPPPKIRYVFDLDSLMASAMSTLGMPFDRPGTTGVETVNQGGMTLLSWLQTLGAYSRTSADDNQRTLMPKVWGQRTWAFEPKDTTTKDFTVLADGSRIVLNLVDDVAEQPTTIYGSGVTTDGERWDGSVYPGLFQGSPAPYPYADTSTTFGLHTEDGDTDTGDGITVMVKKLCWSNLLNDRYFDLTEITTPVVAAINRLKDLAGLTQNGTMTYAAWQALWDTDVVSFSTLGARIMPIVEVARVRSWNYSSAGSIIGRNPAHQAGAVRVSRTIDFGVCDEDVARRYASSLVHPYNDHDWSGTIVLNKCGVFSGEHDDSDVADLTADDVMSARDIRPGMNAWLPYFDGGTLLHVSGVDVSSDSVTLTVSSTALDIFDITQALQRNQDSKRNIYREWQESNLGRRPSHNFVSRDKHFGRLGQDVHLTGGQWNVIELPLGSTGNVSRTLIRTADDATEFYVAVFAEKVTETAMDSRIGDPSVKNGDDQTVWESLGMDKYFQNRTLLYIAGGPGQPCGYWWRQGYKSDGTRTANPLTGTFLDDSSWPYITARDDVAYMAIWPVDDCTLQAGRLFYALEDDVT